MWCRIILFSVILYISDAFPAVSEDFSHSLILKEPDVYKVFWKFNKDNITFEIQVKTKGWVGFGLSTNGGMSGSDIVMGWVKDGKATLSVS